MTSAQVTHGECALANYGLAPSIEGAMTDVGLPLEPNLLSLMVSYLVTHGEFTCHSR